MWWIKHDTEAMAYPTVEGPYETEAEAQAALDTLEDGTLVEADLSYPHTLKHPIGKLASGDGQDNTVYSDGTTEPIE